MSELSSKIGERDPGQCWQELADSPHAQIVDVRTAAEWTFVGVPDVTSLGREVVLAEWQSFPSMQQNARFADDLDARLTELGLQKSTPLYFLCRSGVRSLAAARAMQAAGYDQCFNITGGFEGNPDEQAHRGNVNGWKVSGLPWVQR